MQHIPLLCYYIGGVWYFVVETIRNMGCGGCHALYFCGKRREEVI